MKKYFKERWNYIADAGYETDNIESTKIIVNNFEVSIKMSEDFKHKGDIEYTFNISYDHEIFTKEYNEVLNLEQPCDCDQFCDELSDLRARIEEGIEKYLKDNDKLKEIEY
ncbi:hypothetical protein KWL52_006780 [Clostridioides difficile]|nr:hypothetical protein [Clostridioides difficile]MCZ1068616.1 hypothetical protein [Clostridioides difficile]MDC2934668.1 hypothetical protein [Clostridioides difficile]MDS6381705.1 hypothetical protein [Clostridioides difficile]HBG0867847.1 hypothetical protein [Clostridioides difficile]